MKLLEQILILNEEVRVASETLNVLIKKRDALVEKAKDTDHMDEGKLHLVKKVKFSKRIDSKRLFADHPELIPIIGNVTTSIERARLHVDNVDQYVNVTESETWDLEVDIGNRSNGNKIKS